MQSITDHGLNFQRIKGSDQLRKNLGRVISRITWTIFMKKKEMKIKEENMKIKKF